VLLERAPLRKESSTKSRRIFLAPSTVPACIHPQETVGAEDHNCKLLGYKQHPVWILQCGRVADADDDRR
jgi:hypothetical protein